MRSGSAAVLAAFSAPGTAAGRNELQIADCRLQIADCKSQISNQQSAISNQQSLILLPCPSGKAPRLSTRAIRPARAPSGSRNAERRGPPGRQPGARGLPPSRAYRDGAAPQIARAGG